MVDVKPGTILIADPFLKDPNFKRTSVFICEHEPAGSFGFVLNRLSEDTVGDLIPNLENCKMPVYYGGPVQTDTLHFLHQCPDIIEGGIEIVDGIFWGGNFEEVIAAIHNKTLKQNHIRFYIGYSGWGEGQLDEELKAGTWLTTEGNRKLIFHKNIDAIWQDALKQKGGEFSQLIHYPIDPQLN